MHATLVIMAAGIGSRFGTGIKQLTKMGLHDEIIMDYSIFDAMEAGFDKVVFIIRKDIEKEFKEVIGNRIEKYIKVEYAYQSLQDLPNGFSCPADRKKPWGTGQAVLCAKDIVKEPFVILNADDYYGKEAFQVLYQYLEQHTEGMAMAGFVLKNTLSENGTVTRGVVKAENGYLTDVRETKEIENKNGHVTGKFNGKDIQLHEDDLCSMNIWAAYPKFFEQLEEGFIEFLEQSTNLETDEFLVPIYVDEMVKKNEVSVKVLPTHDKWIGITYKEDIDLAKSQFKELIASGVYDEKLWK